MKTIRTFNSYTNGADSKLNVYFTDGTEFHRTITSYESSHVRNGGEAYVCELMEKYKEPQPRPEYPAATKDEERAAQLRMTQQICPLSPDEEEELSSLDAKYGDELSPRQSIGRKIADRRVMLGMTQAELAEHAGLHRTHILRIEKGAYSVTLDVLNKIANALSCTIELMPK